MNFTLTEEQAALRNSARTLLQREAPISLARGCYDDSAADVETLWRHIVDAGWLELPPVEAALVIEECAYFLAPIQLLEELAGVTFNGLPGLDKTRGTDAVASSELALVLLAADTMGAARWLLDATVSYVKTREQFGVPIGSFQAVQHRCADMLVGYERAWSATYYAAMCAAEDDPELPRAAAVAKAAAADASIAIARGAIQLHGGIGYTWEHDLHLYMRRVYANEPLLGDAAQQRERLADLIGA